MRLNKYIFSSLVIAGFALSSCDDYLSPTATEYQTTDSFYSTEGQIDQALTGVYHCLLPMALHYWYMSEVRSDNTWLQQDAERTCYNIGFFRSLTTEDEYESVWEDYYELIADCNTFIEKVEDFEMTYEEAKQQYLGEVHFLRALAYFDLVRYFGNIPLVDRVMTQAEALELGQSSPSVIYENIILPDLEYAIENLLDEPIDYLGSTTTGHACRIAAVALRGKVYATMAGFPVNDTSKESLALADLKEVIDYAESSGKYWASGDGIWPHIWISDNDNKYHIFEIQYTNGGLGLGNTMVFNSLPNINNSTRYTTVRIFGLKIFASDGLAEDFGCEMAEDTRYYGDNTKDERAAATMVFENVQDDDGDYYNNQLPFFWKFFEAICKRSDLGYTDIDSSISDYEDWPIDWPIIRLEDAMLLYAELAGPTSEAISLVNKIRNRVGLDDLTSAETGSASAFDAAVNKERRLELCCEGQRWFDMVRRNEWEELSKAVYETRVTPTDDVPSNINSYMYYYPIPDTQIKVKDGLYTQNDGY